MKIDIYRKPNSMTYYAVPAGTGLESVKFPSETIVSSIEPYKMQHEIVPGRFYVGVDVQDIIDQINAGGYAVSMAKATFEES